MLAFLALIASLWLATATAGSTLIGTLDADDGSSGDGAGCFFFLPDSESKPRVLVDRDGYGWMRIDGEIEKLEPEESFVMWPSLAGARLTRVYRSEASEAELEIEVTSGCGPYEDNCAVTYGGTLKVKHGDVESTVKVEGNCAC